MCSIPSATFHRHPHHCAHASCSLSPLTGTSTYAQKSWGGHPRCDLAPLTTSSGTVAYGSASTWQWRARDFPRNATAHCAARANNHVPHWCSVLVEVDLRTCRLLTTGTVTRCVRCTRRWTRGCVSWVLLCSLVARCRAILPFRDFLPHSWWRFADCSVQFARSGLYRSLRHLVFVGDLVRGGPRRAEVCNLCSLLKGNRSDFQLFLDDLEFCRIPQIPHDGITVSYKFPVCATRTQVGTELREEVVVTYAVGLVSLTICPFVSLYPEEFCLNAFIADGDPSVPLPCVGLGHCMFGQSVVYAKRFAQYETPRPRSSSFRLVHAFTIYNCTVREGAFLCGYGKDYAAAIRGLGRRMRFAGCVPFDVPRHVKTMGRNS